ncbi:MAG: haloacid dehalogenase type II [Rhodospirillaceae bacterium]|jgi:2-haloacid dehalogenase|nr:haloacid dehalogenase type II [Rhodospirillaceae bacterium]MBT4589806.1 haloacid dehalogenase type II [Rhodospirillaceae bacterium]MBT5941982.1 haloacid dehalogenase type II [Rhodospirillaceae bacterium]MBT7268199.1 haloacid dehalogenase type II [Rhodospirillaceae bacterium]
MSTKLENIGACVFDAYGTLFDVNSAAAQCKDDLGDDWEALSDIWRMKQLNYTWLRSLMEEYRDFWQITGDALDFAMDTLGINDNALRGKLMNLYSTLDAYPEVPAMLKTLRANNVKTAILSNGSPNMLGSAVEHASLGKLFDAVISVDSLQIYKPHPSVYQLAVDELNLPAEQICFMSSNAWDVAGAANFGFQVNWVNRFGQARERLPGEPVNEIKALDELPALLGH